MALDGVGRNSTASRETGLAVGFAAVAEPTLQQAVGELARAVRRAVTA